LRMSIQKEEKRANILKAAIVIFSKDGYHQAKMEDIAKMAGIGKGTIYLYFESKRQLFYSMIKEITDKFLQGIYGKIKGEQDLKKVLETILTYTFDCMHKHQDMTSLMINRPGTVDEDMQGWLSAQRTKIIEFLAGTIEDYALLNNYSGINYNLAAHSFLGMIVSLIGEQLLSDKNLDVKNICDEIIQMFFYGIKHQAVNA